MNRYTPRQSKEFESRQKAFEFGEACRFVAELAASVKKQLTSFWKKIRPTPPAPTFKTWIQLVLPSDDIHQLPLFV